MTVFCLFGSGALRCSLRTGARLFYATSFKGAAGLTVAVSDSSLSSDSFSSSQTDSSVSSSAVLWALAHTLSTFVGLVVIVIGTTCESLNPFLAISSCELRGAFRYVLLGDTTAVEVCFAAGCVSMAGLATFAFVVAAEFKFELGLLYEVVFFIAVGLWKF